MLQTGVLLGGEQNTTRKQMADIIEFEKKIALITIPMENRRDEEKLYNLMSISELQKRAPFVSLSRHINLISTKILSRFIISFFFYPS